MLNRSKNFVVGVWIKYESLTWALPKENLIVTKNTFYDISVIKKGPFKNKELYF